MEKNELNELNKFISPVKNISSGYDREWYYDKIIKDVLNKYFIINRNKSEIKLLKQNPNQNLLNEIILTTKDCVETYRYLTTITNMIRFIYTSNSREYGILMRIDKSFKYTLEYSKASKTVLKYIKLPEHYIKALKNKNEKTKERIKHVNRILEEWIKMTPLDEYRKTLPEGTSLIDDIWEHIDVNNTDWKDPYERERVIKEYMEHIMQFIDIKSESELKKHYSDLKAEKDKQFKMEKEARKQQELLKKRDIADEMATDHIRQLKYEWSDPNNLTIRTERLYKKALNIKEPKIYVLVSTYNITQRKHPVIKYLNENLNLTDYIGAAKVYANTDPLPDKIKELYESCKYGYAEMLLM